MEVYKAREGDRKMAWKFAAQRMEGSQGLLGDSSDLDAVVIGDPLGVYCRAWKWGKVKHIVFKEQHKDRAAVISGGVEQVTLEEALQWSPRVVIAVLGGGEDRGHQQHLGSSHEEAHGNAGPGRLSG